MHRYKAFNAPMPTTAPPAAVATGTSTKTMLQLATPSTRQIQLISWGYTLSGLVPLDPNAPASLLTLGTSATGYTASAEGSVTATRLLDADQIPTTAGTVPLDYDYQWMPDERPIIAVSKFLRVRATMPTTGVNLLCWVCWDE